MLMSKTEALSFRTNSLPVVKIGCRHSHAPCLTNVYIIFGNRSYGSHQQKLILQWICYDIVLCLGSNRRATVTSLNHESSYAFTTVDAFNLVLNINTENEGGRPHLPSFCDHMKSFSHLPNKREFHCLVLFFFPSEVWGRLTLPGEILLPWCSVLDKQLAPNF